MSDNMSKNRPFDAISEGTHSREKGQRREACPYPAGSQEREDWLQGFDGEGLDQPPDLPMDQTG